MTRKQKHKKQKNATKPTIVDQIKNTLSEVIVVWKTAKGEAPNTGGIFGIFSSQEIADKVIEREQENLPDDVIFTSGAWQLDYKWHNMKPVVKYFRRTGDV